MTPWQAFNARRVKAAACLALASFALTACAKPAPRPPPPAQTRMVPACKLDGCCRGHGEVAYVQPDRFIMCTDGETSRICDCH